MRNRTDTKKTPYAMPEMEIYDIGETDVLTYSLTVRLESVGDELSWEIFENM